MEEQPGWYGWEPSRGREYMLLRMCMTLRQLGHLIQKAISYFNIIHSECNILLWNSSNIIYILSVLQILVDLCFSTRASVATVLSIHSSISSCLENVWHKVSYVLGTLGQRLFLRAHGWSVVGGGGGLLYALPLPEPTLIARFMGPTWGPSGANKTQVGPMLAPWTLLSGKAYSVTNFHKS